MSKFAIFYKIAYAPYSAPYLNKHESWAMPCTLCLFKNRVDADYCLLGVFLSICRQRVLWQRALLVYLHYLV